MEHEIQREKTIAAIAEDKLLSLQSDLEKLQAESQQLKNMAQAIARKETAILDQIRAWQTVLTSEGLSPAETEAESLYGAKASVVRSLLKKAGRDGLVPKELTEQLSDLGIQVSASFASNALFRMKNNKEVHVVGSRYFWEDTR